MKVRTRVLGFLSLLMVITYLDRICLSVAGPRVQDALHIGPVGWGWVNSLFVLSFGFFEIPTGALGDRIGPRKVLTRVVAWWSAFTALTGAVVGLPSLLVTRFLFGMGEAGSYPNAAIVVGRWFPLRERARTFGVVLMGAQAGGMLAPLLIVPLQIRFGWRASFYVLGVIGAGWCCAWHWWFRDSPLEKAGTTEAEVAEIGEGSGSAHQRLPWGYALRSTNFWAAIMIAFCYIYSIAFFTGWLQTYMVKSRGFSEKGLLWSALPFLMAACANLLGGFIGEWLVGKIGLKWGRCAIGVVGLGSSAVMVIAAMMTSSAMGALVLLSLANAGIMLQQPTMFSVCLDIGGEYAGAMTGAMNTAAQVGSFTANLAFGYIVKASGSYELPMIPMAFFLGVGVLLWLVVDPRKTLLGLSRDGAHEVGMLEV